MTINHKLKKFRFNDPLIQQFFDVLGEGSNQKVQLFCFMALTTGLRVSEILNLSYNNVEEKTSVLSARSSKKGEIKIILDKHVFEVLKEEHEINPSDNYIFQSKKSNNVLNQSSKQISRQAVNFAFKKVNDITGSSITPNKLRQIYATEFFKKINMRGNHILMKKHFNSFENDG